MSGRVAELTAELPVAELPAAEDGFVILRDESTRPISPEFS
jgi:hypothetical protein